MGNLEKTGSSEKSNSCDGVPVDMCKAQLNVCWIKFFEIGSSRFSFQKVCNGRKLLTCEVM